jgi:uncharacterized protein (DUF488 family)
MNVYTIGFTKKSARSFFTRIRDSDAGGLIDVRLNNVSQLAGFSKRNDLEYFTETILGIPYRHLTELAPTQSLLDQYKKITHDWAAYERNFLQLMAERRVEDRISKEVLADACLLCTEPTAERCHRRLVAEYLRDKWGDVDIHHL